MIYHFTSRRFKFYRISLWLSAALLCLQACGKSGQIAPTPAPPADTPVTIFSLNSVKVDGLQQGFKYQGTSTSPVITISFNAPVAASTEQAGLSLKDAAGKVIPIKITAKSGAADSVLLVTPVSKLEYLTKYNLALSTELHSSAGTALQSGVAVNLLTAIDSSDKFERITDSSLLTLIQKRSFAYFWDLANPVSGMALERSSTPTTCTTGGTGFGIMAIIAAVKRQFITKADGLARVEKIVQFLTDKCTTYHGAFAHWINGNTGATIAFSPHDNGGDIVETSYLMMGLLSARQFFNSEDATQQHLRTKINQLWDQVDWTWYQQNQQVLYWNWSPDYQFAVNVKVQGYNEALITYVLAASSKTHSINKTVYDEGWAASGALKNGHSYFGYTLPLGPDLGGPLFFEQYSFMGLNPRGLTDVYGDYDLQTKNHSLINYAYCVSNPLGYYGYSAQCWGLTASDIQGGYSASSPTNDLGVIAPTAAVSALAFTPEASMAAIRFFYYQLGDRILGKYGFYDAFNLTNPWVDSDYLAIDQGPQVVMIENYRSGFLWQLFMSCPEVKSGLQKLGFSY